MTSLILLFSSTLYWIHLCTVGEYGRYDEQLILKCKKTAVTVLYVYGLSIIVYPPFGLTMLVEAFIGYTRSVKIAYDFANTVVFINS